MTCRICGLATAYESKRHPGEGLCMECRHRMAREWIKRVERHQARRERNAALRELCGTSAAAARRDMGM